LSTIRLDPASPRDSGRVTNVSEGVGGGGFGGFGEGVILIDLIPLTISPSVIVLSPSTSRILRLSPSEAGRVKVGFGLTCGGGGGCGGSGEGVILIDPISSATPSSSSPSVGLPIDRRKVSACCRGDTCICSVETGAKLGPLSMSQPHSLPIHFPSSPPGQLRSATATYPMSGWSTFRLGSGPGRSLYSSRLNADPSLTSVGHGGGSVISSRLRTASSPHTMERRSFI